MLYCVQSDLPLCVHATALTNLFSSTVYINVLTTREKGENMIYLKRAKITTVVKNYERTLSQIKQERILIQHSHGYDA